MIRDTKYLLIWLGILLIVLGMVGCTTKLDTQSLVDNKVASHYSGCIEGFMITIKLDMYRRPKKYSGPKDAMRDVRSSCRYQNMHYQLELEKSLLGLDRLGKVE